MAELRADATKPGARWFRNDELRLAHAAQQNHFRPAPSPEIRDWISAEDDLGARSKNPHELSTNPSHVMHSMKAGCRDEHKLAELRTRFDRSSGQSLESSSDREALTVGDGRSKHPLTSDAADGLPPDQLSASLLARIFRKAGWWWHEKALRPGMIGVATHQSFPKVRRAFSWFKVAV